MKNITDSFVSLGHWSSAESPPPPHPPPPTLSLLCISLTLPSAFDFPPLPCGSGSFGF